jgi:nucleotide-binding universal stress UspA family protein
MDINKHLQRKFLVIVDGTPESHAALRFAARRAHGTGGKVTLLLLLGHDEFKQWAGIGNLMKEEARTEAEAVLRDLSSRVEALGGETPEQYMREGNAVDIITDLLQEDPTISTLVLAAGSDPAGPGPLVSALARGRGGFPIPVTVIPAGLLDDEIDALT